MPSRTRNKIIKTNKDKKILKIFKLLIKINAIKYEAKINLKYGSDV